jgi:hypothetical protein
MVPCLVCSVHLVPPYQRQRPTPEESWCRPLAAPSAGVRFGAIYSITVGSLGHLSKSWPSVLGVQVRTVLFMDRNQDDNNIGLVLLSAHGRLFYYNGGSRRE